MSSFKYLLYECEVNDCKQIRLAREDGRLDGLVGTFKTTDLKHVEKTLRKMFPAIVLEVHLLI